MCLLFRNPSCSPCDEFEASFAIESAMFSFFSGSVDGQVRCARSPRGPGSFIAPARHELRRRRMQRSAEHSVFRDSERPVSVEVRRRIHVAHVHRKLSSVCLSGPYMVVIWCFPSAGASMTHPMRDPHLRANICNILL